MSRDPARAPAARPAPGGALDPWISERLRALAELRERLVTGPEDGARERLFAAVRAVLGGILPFEASGFLLLADDLDFELASCAPAEASEPILGEVARAIEAGSFGWALAQGRLVLLPAPDVPRTLVLHALATPTRTLGMFAGLLPEGQPLVARVEQELVSIALHQCAAALENALLTREQDSRGQEPGAGHPAREHLAGAGLDPAQGTGERLVALRGELGWLLSGLRELADRLLAEPALEVEGHELGLRIQGAARALGALVEDARELAPDPPLPLAAPLAPQAKSAPLPDAARAEPGSGARVLVVEDNAVNQKVMARILEKLGCQVDLAADGVAALECLEHQSYQLVFMDCRMPEMDGFETTAAIRRRERSGAHTPIVAVTADTLDRDRERCLRAGMDDHVSKPVRSADLRRMLERWIVP